MINVFLDKCLVSFYVLKRLFVVYFWYLILIIELIPDKPIAISNITTEEKENNIKRRRKIDFSTNNIEIRRNMKKACVASEKTIAQRPRR